MKISWIGLGAMGYPMARHLARDHEVTVWNRTSDVAVRHAAEHGTRQAATLEECAQADVVISMLPTSREVDEVAQKLIPLLPKGILWLDATSGDPKTCRETACRLAGAGVEFVDAPVTGGTPGAEAGTLTVMIGGTPENFARAEAVAKSYAKKIVHVGPLGAGNALKAINNAMLAANLWSTAECMLMAREYGIEVKTALDVVNAGSGRSNASENLLPMRLLEGKWPLTFKLSLHDKDVRIAASMAHDKHLAAPMLALVSQLFTAALHELGDKADYIEVAKYAAKMSGEEWQ